ncbi:MAG: RNA polymerase sigma factor [Planctomycetota bacterium]
MEGLLPAPARPLLDPAPQLARLGQIVWSVDRGGRADERSEERTEFERRVHAAWPGTVRLVERLLAWPGSSSDVEDVVQDVLLAAWRGRRTFRGEAEWTTWLHTIAVRRARNAARARARRERWFGRPDSDAVHAAEDRGAPAGTPDAGEPNAAVRSHLRRLRHADREVLVLRYLEELDVEEIARRLGLKRAAVDARLSRARKRLASLMGEGSATGAAVFG